MVRSDPTPHLSIVIPVYNKWELTCNCLQSLQRHTADLDFEVLVVDNGSTDATAGELLELGKRLFGKRFSSLVFPTNKNFGPACNAGAKAAASPLLLFLNNDTIVTPGWAFPLLEAMRRDSALGAVGPLLLYEDGTVQHLGVSVDVGGLVHLYQHFPSSHPVVSRSRSLQFITGAAFLIRKALFFECGGFFEGYRNGFEDVELCLRIRQKGKKVVCIPQSKIIHLESQSDGRFSKNPHNGLLLKERCEDDIYIDLHTHALADGFLVAINDALSLSVLLPEEEEKALNNRAQGKSSADWLRLIEENPLWVHGREVMAQSLEQARKFSEAAVFRAALLEINPSLASCKALLYLASEVSDLNWLPAAEQYITDILRYRNDPKAAFEQVALIATKFSPNGDAFLESAYRQKLKEFGHV